MGGNVGGTGIGAQVMGAKSLRTQSYVRVVGSAATTSKSVA